MLCNSIITIPYSLSCSYKSMPAENNFACGISQVHRDTLVAEVFFYLGYCVVFEVGD